jgi:hypothetical protein
MIRTPPSRAVLDNATTPERTSPMSPLEERIREAYEELRALHEAGEIEWSQTSPLRAHEMAFLDK